MKLDIETFWVFIGADRSTWDYIPLFTYSLLTSGKNRVGRCLKILPTTHVQKPRLQ